MKLDEWLTTVPISRRQKCPARAATHVYPDGHGDFCVEDGKGRLCGKPNPSTIPPRQATFWRESESCHESRAEIDFGLRPRLRRLPINSRT